MDKTYRLPVSDEQKAELTELLNKVPKKVVETIEWKSPEGREFVKAVREIQLKGVPLVWIAETLGVGTSAMQGAIAYWARSAKTRGSRSPRSRARQPRPLKVETPPSTDVDSDE